MKSLKKMLVALISVVFLVTGALTVNAAVLYVNDFGTTDQQADVVILGTPLWEQTWSGNPDLDGDGLYYCAVQQGLGTLTIIKEVEAPIGKLISNPVFSAVVSGYPKDWGTGGTIYLSNDGVNWDHPVTLTTQGWQGATLTTSASDGAQYDKMSSVWVRLDIIDFGGNNPTGVRRPTGGNIQVSGDLSDLPATGGVKGKVDLDNYRGDKSLIGVEIEFRTPNTINALFSKRVFLDANGYYLIEDVAPATYDLAFKTSHSLRKVASSIPVGAGAPTLVNVELQNGDVDGSNSVGIADYNAVVANIDEDGD